MSLISTTSHHHSVCPQFHHSPTRSGETESLRLMRLDADMSNGFIQQTPSAVAGNVGDVESEAGFGFGASGPTRPRSTSAWRCCPTGSAEWHASGKNFGRRRTGPCSEDEDAASGVTGYTRWVAPYSAPAFEPCSAPKHLRMVVPPSGRRRLVLRGRGRSQRCHWLHQVRSSVCSSGVRVLLGLETPPHGRAALRAALPSTS